MLTFSPQFLQEFQLSLFFAPNFWVRPRGTQELLLQGSALRNHSWAEGILGIKQGLAAYKAKALPAMLLLRPYMIF